MFLTMKGGDTRWKSRFARRNNVKKVKIENNFVSKGMWVFTYINFLKKYY